MLFRAARLVADTGLHARQWSREETIRYLSSVTGDPESRSAAEVERYCVVPAQALSYKIGHTSVAGLRSRIAARLGRAFDLRRFHREVLGQGSLPLDQMERLVESRF
jgi:uncharacterized protein (DUF885 family)